MSKFEHWVNILAGILTCVVSIIAIWGTVSMYKNRIFTKVHNIIKVAHYEMVEKDTKIENDLFDLLKEMK